MTCVRIFSLRPNFLGDERGGRCGSGTARAPRAEVERRGEVRAARGEEIRPVANESTIHSFPVRPFLKFSTRKSKVWVRRD